MSYKVKTELIVGADLAALELNIDAFLAAGNVLITKKINSTNTQALLIYYNIYDNFFANGILSFGLDGSTIGIYNNFYPAVLATGIEATTFNVANNIGVAGNYNWIQLGQMIAAGIENQCHTFDHTRLTTLTFAQIQANLAAADALYIANGLLAPQHIAYPFGSFNDTVKAACATMRLSGRTIEPYVMYPQWRDVDKFEITAIFMDAILYPENMNEIKTAIDQAILNKSLLTIYDHGNSTQAQYEEIINYGILRGINILKYSDAYALLEP